jgi:hypothetical protein
METALFLLSPFKDTPPTYTFYLLVNAIHSTLHPSSQILAAWHLQRLRDLLKITLIHGLGLNPNRGPLTATEKMDLEKLPRTLPTVLKWLRLDPHIVYLNCCSKCFATYALDETPLHCLQETDLLEDNPKEIEEDGASNDLSKQLKPQTCGQPLFWLRGITCVPVRRFGFQKLANWIARLLSREGIEDLLDQSIPLADVSPNGEVSDIHQSTLWKDFHGPNGRPFTSES